MEPRPVTRHKENVPPRLVVALRPEHQRPRKSLGTGGGQWVPVCQATTLSPGAMLRQEPHQVQSNLAVPNPHLALEDTTGRLVGSGLRQQSNLQLQAVRPQRKVREPTVQQSNLCFRGTTSPHLRSSSQPLTHPFPRQRQTPLAADTLSSDLRLSGGLVPFEGLSPRSWHDLGSWAPRLTGEPLTLEDLAVCAHRQPLAPSLTSPNCDSWLVALVLHQERETAGLGTQTSQEAPGPAQQGSCTCRSWEPPEQPQISQPILHNWDKQKRSPWGPRGSTSLLETLEIQAELSESPAHKPLLPQATLRTLDDYFLDSEQETLSTQSLWAKKRCPPGPSYDRRHTGYPSVIQGAGNRGPRLDSSAPQKQAGRNRKGMNSSWLDAAPSWTARQNKVQSILTREPQAACWQLLSRCFRAWKHLSQRQQAAAAARDRRQLLHWALWLREAQLKLASGRHAKALLAWSFREWKYLAQQQKLGSSHTQPASGFLTCPGGQSLGRKVAVDPTWRYRCFRAWQKFVQRRAQYRSHLAHHRARTLRLCLGQWVRMKQLRASDVAKVTQLALYQQKAGNKVPHSSVPGIADTHDLQRVTGWLPQELHEGSLWKASWKLALHRTLLLWRTRLCQHQQATSFFQGMQKRALRCILSWWHLRAWGPDMLSGSKKSTSALEPWSSGPEGGAWLGYRVYQGLLEKVQAQQFPGTARRCQHIPQRRILLSWSHWTAAQEAQRELAACWAWHRSCRAVMGLWRQRLAKRQAVEQWIHEQGQGLVRVAPRRWLSSWQRQQDLHEQDQKWGQARLQTPWRAAVQCWQQAVAQRRCLRSYFQVWHELVSGTGVPWTQHRAFQEGLRREVPGATLASWRAARRVGTRAQERPLAEASILYWRSFVQQSQADRQLRGVQAQQVFVAWQVAPGRHHEGQHQAEKKSQVQVQVVFCWILWVQESYLGQMHPAYTAQQLTAWVPEAMSSKAGPQHLLSSCWLRWQSMLLRLRLELPTQAQGTDFRHWSRLASRGRILLLHDNTALWVQTHSCWTLVTKTVLPSLAWQYSNRTKRTKSWALSNRKRPLFPAIQLWLPLPAWAPSQPHTGPEGFYKQAPQRCLQASQQARLLAEAWQCWVDAQRMEQLSQTLLRHWHLEQTWRTWRLKALRLWVAQRLHQQENSCVLSQAFVKWYQRLVARNSGDKEARPLGAAQMWRAWGRAGPSGSREIIPWDEQN